MCTHMNKYTYIHTLTLVIHTYTQTYTDIQIHIPTHTYTYTHSHTHIHKHTQTHTHIYIYTHTHVHTPPFTPTHTSSLTDLEVKTDPGPQSYRPCPQYSPTLGRHGSHFLVWGLRRIKSATSLSILKPQAVTCAHFHMGHKEKDRA